jgi:hypothetical protein
MKQLSLICSLLFALSLTAQVSFKTIIPQQPVVAGESFQVQYILEGGERNSPIRPPVFKAFRLITGPNIYTGSMPTPAGIQPVSNFVYTLEAKRPGKFMVPGTSILVNGGSIKSNDVVIEVISKEDALKMLDKKGELLSSAYFLRPGEDPYKKIRENLFVKVQVDRHTCFTGEPILATFKLYSRLQSKSDIIKNPAFYGFTVQDMVNLADKEKAIEKVNGNLFDVHTIRKVQLYPLQAGDFIIDAMEVKNRVEFSRSVVNKKTEQEIAEGMMGVDTEKPVAENTEAFETFTRTSPVTVHVKAWPEKNKPATFTGAAGRFTIAAKFTEEKLHRNEQGFFEITIAGKGNFIQLDAPKITWPAGIEGFAPTMEDNLDKSKAPLSGSRSFRYPFVAAEAGSYRFLPVSFSYFDSDSNKYKTIATSSLEITVTNSFEQENRRSLYYQKDKRSIAQENERAARIAGGIAVVLVLGVIAYWIFRKKEAEPVNPIHAEIKEKPSSLMLLQPALDAVHKEDKEFYTTLRSAIWSFAEQHFGLHGSIITKEGLSYQMKAKGISENLSEQLQSILVQCERGIFTNASLENDKEKLVEETREVFEAIETALL